MNRAVRLVLALVLVAGCGSPTSVASSSPSGPSAPSASPAASLAPSAATSSPRSAEPSLPSPTASGRPLTGADSYDHVFLVVFENKGFSQIVQGAAAPTFRRLIELGALSTDYRGIRRPSLPNYLALVGGSTFGVDSDCSPAKCPVSASNLASLLSEHDRTWKAYLEAMPKPCGVHTEGRYAPKHNPFVYFDDVRTTALCRNVVPYDDLAADLRSEATTPRFVFVAPDLCNDMHDCPIATGDAWLDGFAKAVMASPAWTTARSLLIVTFDEDDGAESNRIATFAIGSPVRQSVRAGAVTDRPADHYALLRTLEHYLGVPTLGRKDAEREVMTGLIPD